MARRSFSVFCPLFSVLVLASCAPNPQPVHEGLTPAQADALAVAAVRDFEHAPSLPVEPFDTLPTAHGYTVYLQQKTSSATARHWKVRVRPDRSTEILPAEPSAGTQQPFRANPAPLQGNQKVTTP